MYIIVLILVWNYHFINAQLFKKDEYILSNVSEEQGLPCKRIKDIEIDDNGYVWLCTDIGLYRYDGKKSIYYAHPNSWLTRMNAFRYHNNRLYLSYYRDFNLYTFHTNYYEFEDTIKHGYISDDSRGIPYSWDWWKRTWGKNRLQNIMNITTGHNMRYILENQRLYYASNDTFKIVHDNIEFDAQCGSFQDSLFLVITKINKKVLLFQKGLFIDAIKVPTQKIFSPRTKYLYNGPHEQYLWMDSSIYSLSIVKGKLKLSLAVEKIPLVDIISIKYNPVNNKLFIGTLNNGLYIIHKKNFKTLSVSENFFNNIFYSQLNWKGGILVNKFILYPNGRYKPLHYSFSPYLLSPYKDGFFYVSFSNKNTTLNYVKENGEKSTMIIRSFVRDIHQYGHSDTLVLLNEQGICLLYKHNTIPIYQNENLFYNIFHPLSKDLYLIGSNQRLELFNLKNREMTTLMNNINVRSIYMDNKNIIWLGTYGSGYYALYKGKIVKINLDHKERASCVHNFHLDSLKRMWISTNRGLLMTPYSHLIGHIKNQKKQLHYYVFTHEEGLKADEFNGGCVPTSIVLPNGALSLPSMNGLVTFFPESIHINEKNFRITLHQVKTNEKVFSLKEPFRFNNRTNFIEFQFDFPNFENSENIIYEYFIEGFSEKWEISSEKLMLTGLRYGDYILKVRIVGEEGSIKSIPFSIASHWYETKWFRGILLLLFLFLGYGLSLYRNQKIKQRNKELENIVRQKTEHLKKMIDELDSTVEALEESELKLQQFIIQQNELLQLLLHDVRSPIDALKWTIGKLKSKISSTEHNHTNPELLELEQSVKKVQAFVQHFFNWIYKQRTGLQPQIQNTSISHIYDIIASHSLYSHLLTFDDSSIELYTDPNMLSVILRNLVENAQKANPMSIISLTTMEQQNHVVIAVSNEGQTMSKELINKILSQEYESEAGGFGYKIIIHLVSLLGGTLQIYSEDNITKVTVSFPRESQL